MKQFSFRTFFLVVLITGASFRLYGIWEKSYWVDEVLSINVAKLSLKEIVIGDKRRQFFDYERQLQEIPIPLHFIYLHLSLLFGAEETIMRFPSSVFGFFTLLLVFLLGRLVFDRRAGLISMALLSFSVFHINYSQEARFYSFFLFFSTLTLYLLFRYLLTRARIFLALFLFFSIFTILAHYFGLIVIAVQTLFLILANLRSSLSSKPHHAILQVIILLVMVFASSAALLSAFPDVSEHASDVPIPERYDSGFLLQISDSLFNGFAAPAFLFFLLFGTIVCIARVNANALHLLFLGILQYVPMLFLVVNIWHDRYVIFLLPVALIMVSYGVDNLSLHLSRKYGKRAIFTSLFVLILFAASLPRVFDYYSGRWSAAFVQADWREAALYLRTEMKDGDIILSDDISLSAYLHVLGNHYFEYRYYPLDKALDKYWFAEQEGYLSSAFSGSFLKYGEKVFEGTIFSRTFPSIPRDFPVTVYKICALGPEEECYETVPSSILQVDRVPYVFIDGFENSDYVINSYSLENISYNQRHASLQPLPDTPAWISYYFQGNATPNNVTIKTCFYLSGMENNVSVSWSPDGTGYTLLYPLIDARSRGPSRSCPEMTIQPNCSGFFLRIGLFVDRNTSATPFDARLENLTVTVR